MISAELKLFLYTPVTGEVSQGQLSSYAEILADSVEQDIIYAVSHGTQVPQKHIVLPSVVKALTGNVELIQILNRLGHDVSYSTLEENETELCLSKLCTVTGNDAVLLENIHPYVFTTLAWGNIDRLVRNTLWRRHFSLC